MQKTLRLLWIGIGVTLLCALSAFGLSRARVPRQLLFYARVRRWKCTKTHQDSRQNSFRRSVTFKRRDNPPRLACSHFAASQNPLSPDNQYLNSFSISHEYYSQADCNYGRRGRRRNRSAAWFSKQIRSRADHPQRPTVQEPCCRCHGLRSVGPGIHRGTRGDSPCRCRGAQCGVERRFEQQHSRHTECIRGGSAGGCQSCCICVLRSCAWFGRGESWGRIVLRSGTIVCLRSSLRLSLTRYTQHRRLLAKLWGAFIPNPLASEWCA